MEYPLVYKPEFMPQDIEEQFPRTYAYCKKCEALLFRSLKGCVSPKTERFLTSVHRQMVMYPERYPTQKKVDAIDRIYDQAEDVLGRQGRYAYYIIPFIPHREADEQDCIVTYCPGSECVEH